MSETPEERQARLAADLANDRYNMDAFQERLEARLAKMEEILEILNDDLKLRKWLMKALKSIVLVTAAILGFVHAPSWLHHFFGVQEIRK